MSVQPTSWIGRRLTHARQTAEHYHRRAIGWRYRQREGTQRLHVGDVAAEYHVANYKEYWRAHDAMGERPVIEAFCARIAPSDVVWDVGSAVGTYACLAAAAGAEVLAFEPMPTNAHRIRENARLNDVADRVTVHPIALGETNDAQPFRPAQGGVGEGTHRIDDGPETVPVRRGHTITPPPDVVKIDVEGHEPAVLAGLDTHLAGVRVVCVEVHPDRGISVPDVREQLTNAGLTVERMDVGRSEPYLLGVR